MNESQPESGLLPLKECPFCGSAPRLRINKLVYCTDVDCPIEATGIGIAQWNTRATPQPAQEPRICPESKLDEQYCACPSCRVNRVESPAQEPKVELDLEGLERECHKALACIYLELPESIANDVNLRVRNYASHLKQATTALSERLEELKNTLEVRAETARQLHEGVLKLQKDLATAQARIEELQTSLHQVISYSISPAESQNSGAKYHIENLKHLARTAMSPTNKGKE
jgi:hypothetical protein